MPDEDPSHRAPPATSPVGPYEVVATFTDVLRETLAQGSDRALLDAMLARLSEALGYPAIVVGRADGDELELVAAHGFPDDHGLPGDRIHVDEGLTGEAFRTGRPVRCDDARDDPRFVDASGGRHRSSLAVPMRLVDRVWGVLAVESPEAGAFDDADVAVLQPLADQMGWAFDSLRLRRLADERAAREARLRQGFEASAAVITAGLEAIDRADALARMAREVRARFDWGRMAVVLRDDDGVLRCVAEHGAPEALGLTLEEHTGIIGYVLVTGRPHLARHVEEDPYYLPLYADTVSNMVAPLRIAGRVVGALSAETSHRRLDHDDLEVLTRLADQVSLVLHNLELLESEKDTVARLHDLERMKSRLLTIASHELRTPLTVVLGFAEVLSGHAEKLSPEQTREYAVAVTRQATSLAATVEQMFLAAQMEQGELTVHPTPCGLLEVVAEVLRGRGEQVEVLPGTDIEVLADPFRLGQVLESLIDNAVTYAGEAGRIQIDARVDHGQATILVRDEGPGMPSSERDAVFEPFHQVGEHGIAGRRGIGLGLAVSRSLLELMGGSLSLATAEGYGATFTLTLPTPI